jgi:hypothetical protein
LALGCLLYLESLRRRKANEETPAMDAAEPFVTIASFTTAAEAEVARVSLENLGIPCVLADAETVSMMWLWSNSVGGVKLLVAESNAARAAKLLHRRHCRADDYGLEPVANREVANSDEEDETPWDEEPEVEVSEADRTVHRALLAAVFGLVACPPLFHLWSLWLILELFMSGDSISATKRGLLWIAMLLDIASLVAFPALYFQLTRR